MTRARGSRIDDEPLERSRRRRLLLLRLLLLLASSLFLAALVVVAQAAWQEQQQAGCPPGARWRDDGGRSCLLDNGVRHGPGERRVAGVVIERGTWRFGRREGAFAVFHLDGARQGEGAFAADREEGPWLLFDARGALVESGRFVAGRREGPWVTYAPDGQPQRTVFYHDDRSNTEVTK